MPKYKDAFKSESLQTNSKKVSVISTPKKKIALEHNAGVTRTNGWNGGHNFSQLQFVQNSGLTSGIKTHHKNPHLLLGKKPAE